MLHPPRPKAREGLLSSDHSKRGRRFVTILDPDGARVTLLEPWEHAVLVLADGNRTSPEIADMLAKGVEGELVTLDAVHRCLKFFERQQLIEPLGLRRADADAAPGPRTLANLQLAYREWHKDPVKTGQILAGDGSPFLQARPPPAPGLSPTVALPDEEEDAPPSPVGIGTKFVMGEEAGDGVAAGDRPLRSVFAAQQAPTEIGALSDADAADAGLVGPDGVGATAVRTGGSAADEPLEELEGIELGDVKDLLAAVDDDFEAMERAQAPEGTVPVVRATGGEAELPEERPALAPAARKAHEDLEQTLEITRGRTATQRLATPPEAALTPTLVGRPAEDPDAGPVWLSPAPEARGNSDIQPGATIEDTQRFDTPTEAGFAASHPFEIDGRSPPARHASVPAAPRESTTNRTSAHLPARTRAVFERLWEIGVSARSATDAPDPDDRRSHRQESDWFQSGLERLTAGDLELAHDHFSDLAARMPGSSRIQAFATAIEAVLDQGATARDAEMLSRFEGAVADAVEGGRCPRCFAALTPGADACHACGFVGAPRREPTPS